MPVISLKMTGILICTKTKSGDEIIMTIPDMIFPAWSESSSMTMLPVAMLTVPLKQMKALADDKIAKLNKT